MKPTVFVTQIPHKRDERGAWVQTVNIAPASKHGTVRVMMPHSMSFQDTDEVVKALDESLKDYDYERGDTILMLGDPAIIAVAGAVVADYTDRFRILKWERNDRVYISVDVDLGEAKQ